MLTLKKAEFSCTNGLESSYNPDSKKIPMNKGYYLDNTRNQWAVRAPMVDRKLGVYIGFFKTESDTVECVKNLRGLENTYDPNSRLVHHRKGYSYDVTHDRWVVGIKSKEGKLEKGRYATEADAIEAVKYHRGVENRYDPKSKCILSNKGYYYSNTYKKWIARPLKKKFLGYFLTELEAIETVRLHRTSLAKDPTQ